VQKWLRRIRGAVGMGLTWAAGWALVGVLIELFIDPMGSLVDVWPTALAIPGFLGGAVFSAVLQVAESRSRFDELSLPRFAAWGGGDWSAAVRACGFCGGGECHIPGPVAAGCRTNRSYGSTGRSLSRRIGVVISVCCAGASSRGRRAGGLTRAGDRTTDRGYRLVPRDGDESSTAVSPVPVLMAG
jgi:hypothetical protein